MLHKPSEFLHTVRNLNFLVVYHEICIVDKRHMLVTAGGMNGMSRIPSIKGSIRASIFDHKAFCPKQSVNIISVLFPPTSMYPQGRYLWTWYSAFPGSDGTASRPIWFGESASNISEDSTCLALADYSEYNVPQTWFPASLFEPPDLQVFRKQPSKLSNALIADWLELQDVWESTWWISLPSCYEQQAYLA